MSRTQKRGGSSSPIKKYVSFSGATGLFSYYDKKKEEKVELESLRFTVLDTRASITGYNESSGSGISSNMVLNTTREELKVITFNNKKPQTIAEGLYADIKGDIKEAGGKFTTNILCLADVGDGVELINLQLAGASLNGWIDFAAEHPNDAYYDLAITVSKGSLSKREKGSTTAVTEKEEKALDAKLKKNPRAPRPVWFYVLSFDSEELTEDEAELATEEDIKLQSYFEGVTVKAKAEIATDDEPDVEEEGSDDVPF